MNWLRLRTPWSVLALLVLATSGCGAMGSAEDHNASTAALAFYGSLDEPTRACRSLAPGTRRELEDQFGPCARSLPQQHLPRPGRVLHVEVYGTNALVQLDGDDMFLARFADGWRVTAVGCTPRQDRPFDCTLKGP